MKIGIRVALACTASSCLAAQAGAQTVQTLFDPVVLNLGAPGGTPYSAETVNLSSPGSGTNGPQTAQVGVNVRCSKSNYLSAKTVGEVDCLYATLRQDGPHSDGSGLLIDTQNTGMGFLSDTEMVASSVNRATNVVNLALDIQEGVINLGTTMYGAAYNAKTGTGDTALLVQASAGAGWNYALRAMNASGVQYFSLDGQGNTIQNGTARINGVYRQRRAAGERVAGGGRRTSAHGQPRPTAERPCAAPPTRRSRSRCRTACRWAAGSASSRPVGVRC